MSMTSEQLRQMDELQDDLDEGRFVVLAFLTPDDEEDGDPTDGPEARGDR